MNTFRKYEIAQREQQLQGQLQQHQREDEQRHVQLQVQQRPQSAQARFDSQIETASRKPSMSMGDLQQEPAQIQKIRF
jgi:hypothetical protein